MASGPYFSCGPSDGNLAWHGGCSKPLAMGGWRASARWVVGLGLLIAVISGTSAASAQRRAPSARRDRADRLAAPVQAPTEWALDVMVATAAPTLLGGEVRLETPGRFLVDVMAGGNPYADGLGGLVEAYGGGAAAHSLVTAIAGSAGIFRLQAGIRPFPDAGLEILAGYEVMDSQPTVTRGMLEGVTHQSWDYGGFESAPLHVTVHAMSAELGWRFVIADHLVLRIGAGGTFTLASSAHLAVPDAMRAAGSAVGDIESAIATNITRYGFVPEGRVALGWRF